ncbi:MAG: MFS transporter [Oscillospiraceae bacterium]|nr:MFS transporter [Oscillospiraceae bacterium]
MNGWLQKPRAWRACLKKSANSLLSACWFAYFAGYVVRCAYTAALSPMLAELGGVLGKNAEARLGAGSTAAFAAYAAGQLCCAFLLRRFRAERLLLGGMLAMGGCMTLLTCAVFTAGSAFMPFAVFPWFVAILLGLSGFAQAMLWPAIVELLTKHLHGAAYTRANVKLSEASAAGTVLVYLLVPLLSHLANWRWIFPCAALFSFCAAAPILRLPTLPRAVQAPAATPPLRSFLRFPMLPVLLAVTLQGVVRDGVGTWMPVLLTDGFAGLPPEAAVLSAIVLPFVAALSFRFAGWMERRLGNEFRGAAFFFAVGAVVALPLPFVLGRWLAPSVLLMALLTGAMHGINLMLVTQFPRRFRGNGRAGFAAGLVNAFVYLGSAVSMFGSTLAAHRFGWQGSAAGWVGVSAVGAIIFLFCRKGIRKYLQEEKNL